MDDGSEGIIYPTKQWLGQVEVISDLIPWPGTDQQTESIQVWNNIYFGRSVKCYVHKNVCVVLLIMF